MSTSNLIFMTVPGLRPGDITQDATPTLHGLASRGVLCELRPTFPCVTSPVQASMMTGTPPASHGVIANGFYDRSRREVAFWTAFNDVVLGSQIWDEVRAKSLDYTSAVWHLQNIKGASADFVVTPAPIHDDDGTTKLWCYSKPDGLYAELLETLGHFPLQHYWGPLSNIQATRWILQAALWLIQRHRPNFHWIYLPHLDYASQKYGPNSPEAATALRELDAELAGFASAVGESPIAADVVFLVAGEYALTDVTGPIFPNRLLREAGLLAIREIDGAEHIDLPGCKAFAMVDHQFAHVYVADQDDATIARCASRFSETPGVAGVYRGAERGKIGMDHERSGDIVLIAADDRWFAYYWWLDDAAAPGFARTVDIHQKPGYDAVELFIDPKTKAISLDAALVKGSHGVPAAEPRHHTALICSQAGAAVQENQTYRDTDIKRIALELLGSA